MTVWLVRAGSHGEYEQKFLQENRLYVTWDGLNVDLQALPNREALIAEMATRYPSEKSKAVQNWSSQVWPFGQVMQKGDWVVLPLKTQAVVYIGEITGDYQFHKSGPDPYFHSRTLKWIGEAIPRSHFSQDLLYSFGAFMTICRIQRNNAEARLKVMFEKGWAAETAAAVVGSIKSSSVVANDMDANVASTDLEELAQDQIASLIEAKFKGHHLTRLVEAILQAQGYTTWRSPEGADGGADILAGNGAMGFGQQRICVEVKSESGPIDRPTVDKLLGAMTKFNASEGLFVSWSGFKQNVQKELASSFFRLRLWSRKELLEQLFASYEKLSRRN
ncbi:restriction endonuclease [Deefgea sp. CFH1-16]|uniref:restriction endonuclease n=1 Tax=Deefgea sp. CFH1-16 TaxID=2675457 RepID=UPI00194023D7|nr:restriction endonuclease [Deefgea sp. CFH1-16]